MDWITKFLCIIAFVWVIGMYIAIIVDLVGTFKCDDISEEKKQANQIDKDLRDKRSYYIFCIKDTSVVDGDKMYYYLRKIDEYLTSYNIEQFDRFYTVYCKELCNTLMNISKYKYTSLYYDLVMETRQTYGSIFSKMLTDVETAIKNGTTSDTDIEGIKSFAKINGDFDENYKAETVSKQINDTDIVLTDTTSAVENRAKNYANALAHAYEEVSQCKKENAQLTKELEKCRAEAKKHRAKNMNNADVTEAKRKRDLERLNELYCWGIPANEYFKNWESEFDYTHDYMYYDGLDGIVYESL